MISEVRAPRDRSHVDDIGVIDVLEHASNSFIGAKKVEEGSKAHVTPWIKDNK